MDFWFNMFLKKEFIKNPGKNHFTGIFYNVLFPQLIVYEYDTLICIQSSKGSLK